MEAGQPIPYNAYGLLCTQSMVYSGATGVYDGFQLCINSTRSLSNACLCKACSGHVIDNIALLPWDRWGLSDLHCCWKHFLSLIPARKRAEMRSELGHAFLFPCPWTSYYDLFLLAHKLSCLPLGRSLRLSDCQVFLCLLTNWGKNFRGIYWVISGWKTQSPGNMRPREIRKPIINLSSAILSPFT